MELQEKFSEWYQRIVREADLSDNRYPIKGMNVWLPYGWKIMLNIDNLIRELLNKHEFDEVMFPLLIPETQFSKEKEHIKGFDEQVYWVMKAGKNVIDIPLLLRPTSETAMYPMFALWIRSHADLPLKVYQIVNTFRYETKQTRAFIRVREIHFFEAHTCHTNFEDAEKQIREYIEIIKVFCKKLCLPYILTKRPDWDKFAGAYYSVGIDVLMPTGRTLQIGSVHQYRDNFSRAYNIKYETEDGEHMYVHQTTYGMSERLIGAIVGIHGDEVGLRLPPVIAPVQVVIVPIYGKIENEKIDTFCKEIETNLIRKYRVKFDTRALTPGNKYYYWEKHGVPLRIEIGPKEIEDNTITIVRRDTHERIRIYKNQLIEKVEQYLREISINLFHEAERKLNDGIKTVVSIDETKNVNGIIKLGWCGSDECGKKLEETFDVNTLGTPYQTEKCDTVCVWCGKKTDKMVYMAKTF